MKHFADSMYAIADARGPQRAEAVIGEGGSTRSQVHTEEQQDRSDEGTHADGGEDTSYLLKPMSCPLHLSFFFERAVGIATLHLLEEGRPTCFTGFGVLCKASPCFHIHCGAVALHFLEESSTSNKGPCLCVL